MGTGDRQARPTGSRAGPGKLLGFVGPLALAVVGGGAFARYVRFARKAFVPVTMEDAARATVSQIQELVRYVLQSHPGVILDGLLES